MTTTQRKIHVLMWLVLGPVALVGLLLAVLHKPTAPVENGPLPGLDTSAHSEAIDAEARP